MPRFTSMPERSSLAMRFAIVVCASMASPIRDKVIDQRRRSDDMVGSNQSNGYNMVGDSNDGGTRHCDNRIEISRRKRIREIAKVVGKKGMNQSKISSKRQFEKVFFSVDFDLAFAFFDHRPNARRRQDPAKTIPPRSDPLDESSLRNKFDGHLSHPRQSSAAESQG